MNEIDFRLWLDKNNINKKVSSDIVSRLRRIEKEFNSKIVELRTECAKGIEDINSLREQEKVQVQGFDKNTVVLFIGSSEAAKNNISVLLFAEMSALHKT